MSEQIDIAVDLGAVAAPLPWVEFLREFAANMPEPPAQVVEGILHRGCKMILGGTSKSNKSWCLLDLAVRTRIGTLSLVRTPGRLRRDSVPCGSPQKNDCSGDRGQEPGDEDCLGASEAGAD